MLPLFKTEKFMWKSNFCSAAVEVTRNNLVVNNSNDNNKKKPHYKHFLECTLTVNLFRSWSGMNNCILEGDRRDFQNLFERRVWGEDRRKETK